MPSFRVITPVAKRIWCECAIPRNNLAGGFDEKFLRVVEVLLADPGVEYLDARLWHNHTSRKAYLV